jgi:hypothetical protein
VIQDAKQRPSLYDSWMVEASSIIDLAAIVSFVYDFRLGEGAGGGERACPSGGSAGPNKAAQGASTVSAGNILAGS